MPVATLLAPSLVFLVLFTYGPVVRVAIESLVIGRFAGEHGFGLGNYQRLFSDPHFARAALNNAFYAAGTIVPSLILALALALALRESNRFTAFLRTLVVMPLLIPLVAAAALFSFILLPGDGLLDFYFRKFGIGMVNWLGDPDTGARRGDRDHDMEEHRLLHAVLPRRARGGAAGFDRCGAD